MKLDHLMWGAPSLAQGMAEIERLFGVRPEAGGSHPGMGTCNALLGLGADSYLEIIAPDPAHPVPGGFAAGLAALDACALITWAMNCTDLTALARRFTGQGLRVRGPVSMQRETPSGECLQWELLFAGGHSFGNLLPFFIDWQECIHPGRSSPAGGELVGLEISTPDSDRLRMLLVDAEPRISIRSARIPGLAARVQVADRIVTLNSSPATSELRM